MVILPPKCFCSLRMICVVKAISGNRYKTCLPFCKIFFNQFNIHLCFAAAGYTMQQANIFCFKCSAQLYQRLPAVLH